MATGYPNCVLSCYNQYQWLVTSPIKTLLEDIFLASENVTAKAGIVPVAHGFEVRRSTSEPYGVGRWDAPQQKGSILGRIGHMGKKKECNISWKIIYHNSEN